MENKYCAFIRVCTRVGPNDLEMITSVLEVTPETTVKHITDWHKSLYPDQVSMHITITNLSTPQP